MGCSGEVECLGGSGGGLEGDLVAECFEFADVVALLVRERDASPAHSPPFLELGEATNRPTGTVPINQRGEWSDLSQCG
jgi:hypothetical protein